MTIYKLSFLNTYNLRILGKCLKNAFHEKQKIEV